MIVVLALEFEGRIMAVLNPSTLSTLAMSNIVSAAPPSSSTGGERRARVSIGGQGLIEVAETLVSRAGDKLVGEFFKMDCGLPDGFRSCVAWGRVRFMKRLRAKDRGGEGGLAGSSRSISSSADSPISKLDTPCALAM